MSDQPSWEKNFPIRQSEEHKASRREFAKFLGCAVLAGAGIAAFQPLLRSNKDAAAELILAARVDEIPVGSSRLFRDPRTERPCILIRLASNRFVAYSQSCTHLMCPVHFNATKKQLICPCHQGSFSAEDGSVLAGPPPQALPRYPVKIKDGQVWVKIVAQPEQS